MGAAPRIAPADPRDPAVEQLLAVYRAELDERFPGGFQPPPNWAATRDALVPPSGTLLLLHLDGSPAGIGAVRVLEPGVAEIKHMWVAPAGRGRGLGRALLAALEQAARDLGCTRALLDTDAVLHEAVTLYEAVGYERIERYNANEHACAIFMGRELG